MLDIKNSEKQPLLLYVKGAMARAISFIWTFCEAEEASVFFARSCFFNNIVEKLQKTEYCQLTHSPFLPINIYKVGFWGKELVMDDPSVFQINVFMFCVSNRSDGRAENIRCQAIAVA